MLVRMKCWSAERMLVRHCSQFRAIVIMYWLSIHWTKNSAMVPLTLLWDRNRTFKIFVVHILHCYDILWIHRFIFNALKLNLVGAIISIFYLIGPEFWDIYLKNIQNLIKHTVWKVSKYYNRSSRMKIEVLKWFEMLENKILLSTSIIF